jgi:hypothetical protein
MTEWRVAAASALSASLDNFHRIDGQILQAVWRVIDAGCLARVVLHFDQNFLIIEARTDDDTVEFWAEERSSFSNVGIDASQSNLWSRFIGKSFGWGWVTINQQGYCDGVLLSFGGITPQVILNVVASSINESTIG